MAFNEDLAARVRQALIEREGYTERKMFGGICFMLHGNMACGIVGDQLIVRVGPQGYADALKQPHASVFDFTGRPMTGWVQVGAGGWSEEANLADWLRKGVAFALSLEPK